MTTEVADNEPLIVVVSGGGPVGLTFALHLTMMMGEKAKIIIYEGRWYIDEQGNMKWQSEQQGKTRRDQVVTLQDHVIDQMPKYVKEGLFKNINERVWPTSRNIAIREVEDRLFDLIQPFVRCGFIELVPENLHEQSTRLIEGDFDILVGADGSNSFVRRYCNIQMISEGLEYACGVAYDIPNNAPEQPLHQALNCILTVSQTRYLVNSSTSRRGYLNIRLLKSEYDELMQSLEDVKARNQAIDLLDSDACPKSPIWSIVRQGLDFFKIPQRYVLRVVPIEINVRHASIVVRELRYEIKNSEKPRNKYAEKKFKTALAFLAGDAAMCVHFWPGRGMNSGMKAAMAIARNIVRSCTKNDNINVKKPLRFLDFIDYEGFMGRLRAREQQGRSLRVLVNPIDKYINAAYSYAHLHHCYVQYKANLIEKLQETRQRLQGNPDWPHQSYNITDNELKSVLNCIEHNAVAQLSLTNPWPTREMSGADVCVEDTFRYDLNKFIPVPSAGLSIQQHPRPISIRYCFVILWISGENKTRSVEQLIKNIQDYQNTSKSSSSSEYRGSMKVVATIDEAETWLKANKKMIEQPQIRFKVVTVWDIEKNKTAVDVIRAVRTESSRAPVLIYTNKTDDIQAALQYPNVLATELEYEVKEFVGINQEALWNPGYLVSRRDRISNRSRSRSRSPSQCPPLLFWIDQSKNVTVVTNEINNTLPRVETVFKPTFSEAEKYLKNNLNELKKHKKFVAISRGYYRNESKNFADIAKLFESLSIGPVHYGVFTRDKAGLSKYVPTIPRGVEMFDNSGDLLAFINRHLN